MSEGTTILRAVCTSELSFYNGRLHPETDYFGVSETMTGRFLMMLIRIIMEAIHDVQSSDIIEGAILYLSLKPNDQRGYSLLGPGK